MATIQISVRLPERLVHHVDSIVEAGEASSRAAVIASAVERDLRRRIYEHDAKTFLESGEYEDLAGFADWSYRNFSAEE